MPAGRPAKPIDWHIGNGNRRHLTNEEIDARKNNESSVRSGVRSFRANRQVMENVAAINHFKKLKKLFKKMDCIEGLDENIINRYCMLLAETDALEQLLIHMNEDVDQCEEYSDRIELYKTISSITSGLDKARNMLLKIEDRLLMNPTARIKNVPPKPKNTGSDPNADLFG